MAKSVLYPLVVVLSMFGAGSASAADPFAEFGVVVPKVRVEAPGFSLLTLDGGDAHLADYSGDVILLNFWATWCGPCREEMPAMQTLWERYRDQGLTVLAVAADRGSTDAVAAFADELALGYPVLLDREGKVRKEYEVVGLPMSYLIGRDGKISGRVIGVKDWAGSEAFALVEHLLGETP